MRTFFPFLLLVSNLVWDHCVAFHTIAPISAVEIRSTEALFNVPKKTKSRSCCSLLRMSKSNELDGPEQFTNVESTDECMLKGENPPLTVILPAFNESLRIEETLAKYHKYLSSSAQWHNSSTQLLVVDDGSTDGTKEIVQTFASSIIVPNNRQQQAKDYESAAVVPIHCISLEYNQGKGAAVAHGIQHLADSTFGSGLQLNKSKSVLVLIADADGSADISCLDAMLETLKQMIQQQQQSGVIAKTINQSDREAGDRKEEWGHVPAIVVGRRTTSTTTITTTATTKTTASDNSTTTTIIPKDRAILRWGFRAAVRMLCGDLGVSDTQCGFKLLTLTAGRQVYKDLHLQGWSHDVEVLYRARRIGIPVTEEAVVWEDKAGSKLVTSSAGGTIGASVRMLVEVALLRICYELGIWDQPADQ